ncbi:SDR family NAD(P)-dependent oxidoreductase [Roseateles sp. BYS180W]|uniref:SDR family NAD(P)-dependent oxidoreductase n=1 Tax=Roseateles rivi TaxID=3299028 RepID=A0ABW7FSQ7_9BURK
MRIAIVTGGSKGLGSALCTQLSNQGFLVIEFSRSAPHAYSFHLDLAQPEAARKSTQLSLQSIDPKKCNELLLINNAGTLTPIGPIWQKSPVDVVANLNTNFTAAILVISEVMRHFRDAPCRKLIVNVTSGAAIKGYAGWSLYCAAKAAMEGFVRALAAEEQHQDQPFVCVSIDPGVIDTEMQALIRATSVADFPDVERFTKRKQDGGLSSPESVAAAIIKLMALDLKAGGRYDAEA